MTCTYTVVTYLGELEFGSALLDLLGAWLGGRNVVGSSRRRHDRFVLLQWGAEGSMRQC